MVGFDVLFESGRRFAEGVVEPRPAGMVTLPSGRLVVGDPTNGGHAPLARRVPPGRYPATVSIVRRGSSERRVAAAMLRFRAGPVVLWEPAEPEGKDADDAPSPEAYFGFGVGSGLACFADSAAPLPYEVKPSAEHTVTELSVGDGTISVFSADGGTYASFWGLDASGMPMVLVTDFRIVGTDETRGAEMLASAWPGASLDDEVTRNWEAKDIIAAPPPPDIAEPVPLVKPLLARNRKAASADNRQQATGNRQQATGKTKRNRQPATGNRQPAMGRGKMEKGRGKMEMGNGEREMGNGNGNGNNRQQATGDRQQATGRAERNGKRETGNGKRETGKTKKSKAAAKPKAVAKPKTTAKPKAKAAARAKTKPTNKHR
jgi:hypothetical protein